MMFALQWVKIEENQLSLFSMNGPYKSVFVYKIEKNCIHMGMVTHLSIWYCFLTKFKFDVNYIKDSGFHLV